MTRTTRADLERRAEAISRVTGRPHEINYAYGRPRLERANGSVDVSPRLSTGPLADWLDAYFTGLVDGQAPR